MKRSEMLKIIRKNISSNGYDDVFEDVITEDAENIMVAIEKAGMLPPGHVFGQYYKNEWEPEDE